MPKSANAVALWIAGSVALVVIVARKCNAGVHELRVFRCCRQPTPAFWHRDSDAHSSKKATSKLSPHAATSTSRFWLLFWRLPLTCQATVHTPKTVTSAPLVKLRGSAFRCRDDRLPLLDIDVSMTMGVRLPRATICHGIRWNASPQPSCR
jgi:hypothetical protein